MVNAERLLGSFLALCATDSGTRRERPLADAFRHALTAVGCCVSEDAAAARIGGEAGNLVAYLPGEGTGAPVVLAVHLDRAAGGTGVRPLVRGETVVSGGGTVLGADDAAGLAAALEALQVLRERGLPHPPVWVVATVAEEAGALGARHLDLSPFRGAEVFVLDGEAPVGTCFQAGAGVATVVASFSGRAARRGGGGVSAITLAASALAGLPQGRLDVDTTGWIGWVAGGTAAGVCPELCEMRGEVRSMQRERLDHWAADWARQCRVAARDAGGRVAVATDILFTPYRLPADTPALQRATAAATHCGLDPRAAVAGNGSDAHIWTERGIPAVLLGAGYRWSHSRREQMPVPELIRLAAWSLAIILEPDAGDIPCGAY